MRTIRAIQILILFSFFSFYSEYAYSQASGLDKLLQAGEEDAALLIEGYIRPAATALGQGVVNGWYNTAKTHQPLGFDITVTLNAAFVPDEDLFYDAAGLPLQSVELIFPPPDEGVPTVFGSDRIAPTYDFLSSPGNAFNGPTGVNLEESIGGNYVPVPIAQIGIGLIKNTDLKVRFMPTISTDDFEIKYFGIGLLHDIKQWIPGVAKAPIDLSVFVGYTSSSNEIKLSGSIPDVGGSDQTGSIDIKAFTYQLLFSKTFSILTLYTGAGGNLVKSDVLMEGTYVLDPTDPSLTLVDPINLNFDDNGLRFTAGLRLKLAIVTLHADYTFQKYNLLSIGFGFSVR